MWKLNENPHWGQPLKQAGQGGELPHFMVSKTGVGSPPGTSDQRTRLSRQVGQAVSCRMVWLGLYFMARPEADGFDSLGIPARACARVRKPPHWGLGTLD